MQQYAEEVIESKNLKRNAYRNLQILRTGETRLNSQGYKICIDRYENAASVYVRFLDSGYVTKTNYRAFQQGQVKDPNIPSVFGKGFLGVGPYKSNINGKATKVYTVWIAMIQRCNSIKYYEKLPSYEGCTVDSRFYSFQEFAKWYEENYYEIEGETMSLDKDILVKNNKIYSPETCCIVPQYINSLFTFSDKVRTDLPVGVKRSGNKFVASASIKDGGFKRRKHIGTYDTPEEAFFAYKEFKEDYYKRVADEYKGKIPEKVHRAMYNYKIEITD